MATTPTAANAQNIPKGRTVVTVCILVGMILIILLVSCWVRSRRPRQFHGPPAIIYTRVAREQREKGISKLIVDSIPLVRYSTVVRITKVDEGVDEEANIALGQKANAPADKTLSSMSQLKSSDGQVHRFLDTCPVCVEVFLPSDEVRILPCGHIYHDHCIDPWLLRIAGTCPIWYVVFEIVALIIYEQIRLTLFIFQQNES